MDFKVGDIVTFTPEVKLNIESGSIYFKGFIMYKDDIGKINKIRNEYVDIEWMSDRKVKFGYFLSRFEHANIPTDMSDINSEFDELLGDL